MWTVLGGRRSLPWTAPTIVIIPGFGPPRLEDKIRWLIRNMDAIRRGVDGIIQVFVFPYAEDAHRRLVATVSVPRGTELWVRPWEKGMLGRFLFRNAVPDNMSRTIRHVIVLLDDVEILGDPVRDLVCRLDWEGIDVVSPNITTDSVSCHKFMFPLFTPGVFRRTNYAELFMYVMTRRGYEKWFGLLHDWTLYLWGIDMAMHPAGITIGILEGTAIRHHIISDRSENSPVHAAMQQEMRRYARTHPSISFKFENVWIIGHEGALMLDMKHINPRIIVEKMPDGGRIVTIAKR